MLKRILYIFKPKTLFARGLLMILMPLVVLQLVIGMLIFQRYFVQVIYQLSSSVIIVLQTNKNGSNTWNKFGITGSPDTALSENKYGYFDISGRLIRQNFANAFGEPVFISSEAWSNIVVTYPTDRGQMQVVLPRSKLAPVNPHQIMLNTMGFSIIFALLSSLFLRNQTRSLKRLSRAAKAFGRGESVDYTPTGADELRSAGRSFLAMRNRITRQREQRNLMLSGVSHDLRTPLTRMRLAVEMLDDDDKKGLIKDIKAIETLADSFLSYASNDAAEEFEDINLKRQIEAQIKLYSMAQFSNAQNVIARIRPVLFSRAIENLLQNSVRYANKIEVSLERQERNILVTISDDGPGISKDLRDSAMKAFSRLDQGRNLNEGGHVGLGMAIAADAIRQHGGDIELGESHLGGLKVLITLPQKII